MNARECANGGGLVNARNARGRSGRIDRARVRMNARGRTRVEWKSFARLESDGEGARKGEMEARARASEFEGWARGKASRGKGRTVVVAAGYFDARGDWARGDGRSQIGARAKAMADASEEEEAKPKPKKVSNFVMRVTSALAMGAAGACIVFAGGWAFVLAMAMFNAASCAEFFGMVKEMNKELPYPPPEWAIRLCVVVCGALPILLHVYAGRMSSILIAVVMSFTALCAMLIVNEESHFNEFTSSLFGIFYCGFLPTFWVKLRGMSGVALDRSGSLISLWPAWLGGPDIWSLGLAATLTTVLCIVSADVGAYAFGKTFGKNKLTAVSPNKTVEGAVGGLLATISMCVALFRALGWPGTLLQGAILGTTVFLTSIFGDLLESVMKRNAKMKDSGDLIPGHGGLLDRFDSYIFTGSVTYYFVIAVLGGMRTIFAVRYY